ncbi:hypothetical protein X809_34620 [Paenibacillus polymyxa CR1]|nr:hypothetical protein X809_34620 [Paenibacillus polymyxa CR1]OMF74672.1 hypothetical protein BK145_23120 [Paenibacillus peoriae]
MLCLLVQYQMNFKIAMFASFCNSERTQVSLLIKKQKLSSKQNEMFLCWRTAFVCFSDIMTVLKA